MEEELQEILNHQVGSNRRLWILILLILLMLKIFKRNMVLEKSGT